MADEPFSGSPIWFEKSMKWRLEQCAMCRPLPDKCKQENSHELQQILESDIKVVFEKDPCVELSPLKVDGSLVHTKDTAVSQHRTLVTS